MLQIIDRRLSGKNKSIGNRERFLRRYRGQIREAVRKAISQRGIREIEAGEDIRIPRRDIAEPTLSHGPGGIREIVHPGNREFVKGDHIARPPQGAGGQGSQASDSGEGEDDFVFQLSKEEFMQVFFEDLALPNLIRTALAELPEYQIHRAGFTTDGTPNNLHVLRSMRGAIGRRIAVGGSQRRELHALEEWLERLIRQEDSDDPSVAKEIETVKERIRHIRTRLGHLPYIDPIDLRYRNLVRVPVPTSRAVMFCLMDVSGSMDEQRKDLAKRFFILLYLFLTRHYERIDLVFIRHHTQAKEVSEDEFFHTTETGGTVVSSALTLMNEIISERYTSQEWNIYAAQASDGDNWHHDSSHCRELIVDKLLPACRYFAYVQVANTEQNLWEEYLQIAEIYPHFAMRKVLEVTDIYPVFRELFRKEGAAA